MGVFSESSIHMQRSRYYKSTGKKSTQHFESMYVSGRRSNQTNDGRLLLRLRQLPPIYPPSVWNLHTATLTGVEKTNNVCEGWNNSFRALSRHQHPALWTCWVLYNRTKRWLQPPSYNTPEASRRRNGRNALPCSSSSSSSSSASTICAAAVVTAL